MNTADNMVNTYAWMKATRSSSMSMKIPKSTDMTVMEPLMTGPAFTVMKIMATKLRMAACPAMMLANRRIIKANGLVKIPNSSIIGMRGTGTFNHKGTFGQKISFQ